ncbi:hypothetical protein Taro_049488 [Colocasia esculenta]|uniref:CCHC-type domain-containing protein n=1 Tax=Colocasia esculenta TaxID=4460 RepID=A0A843XB48_COLES|nr:hypothetical protein [Colocasia esculenta]
MEFIIAMASRGRRGRVLAREDEPRREEREEQQALAPQGPVLPPSPPVDFGVFVQGLVQAHTQAALQAQLEAQWQDKKKAVYQALQRPVTTNNAQVPSQRSPGVKKECPHCGKMHGGSECWMIAGKCLKCGSSDHKIKDCPRLQQGVQRGAPATAVVAAAAPATGRPGRPRALARVFALAREDAEQAEHVTEAQLSLRSSVLDEVIEQQKADPRLLELVGKTGIARDEDGLVGGTPLEETIKSDSEREE